MVCASSRNCVVKDVYNLTYVRRHALVNEIASSQARDEKRIYIERGGVSLLKDTARRRAAIIRA